MNPEVRIAVDCFGFSAAFDHRIIDMPDQDARPRYKGVVVIVCDPDATCAF